jgi:hypothetical protein
MAGLLTSTCCIPESMTRPAIWSPSISFRLAQGNLKSLPLEMRKSLLAELLQGSAGGIVYADHMEG